MSPWPISSIAVTSVREELLSPMEIFTEFSSYYATVQDPTRERQCG
jgi:hypothetical protein